MIELSTFEAWALLAKEQKTDHFIDETQLANFAILHDRSHRNEDPPPRLARWLANLWGCSAQSVNTLARIFEAFNPEEITPDVPLSLWNAVMETDDPRAWLARALAEGLSARQVRDENDSLKGKHLSDTTFCGPDVIVTKWDVATGTFAATGMPLSGEMPGRARVTVREVLVE